MIQASKRISIERQKALLRHEAYEARQALQEARVRAQHLEYLSPPQAAIVAGELRRAQIECAWTEHALNAWGEC